MNFETCIPTGDKVVLEEMGEGEEITPGGIVLPGGADIIRARVVAVGPGIPYGRGEYYTPLAKVGMTAVFKAKVWEQAERFRNSEGRSVRILHERDISFLFQ